VGGRCGDASASAQTTAAVVVVASEVASEVVTAAVGIGEMNGPGALETQLLGT
jgi:hypothetical protein